MPVVITRGDTNIIEFDVYDEDGMIYNLTAEDKVYLGIMDFKQPFEDALIKKVLTVKDLNRRGKLVLRLAPKDTLDLYGGTYYCTAKLRKISKADNIDKVITFIDRVKIIINA